jgi:hypothetical protein
MWFLTHEAFIDKNDTVQYNDVFASIFKNYLRGEVSMSWMILGFIVLAGVNIFLIIKLRRTRLALNKAMLELKCAGTCLTLAIRQCNDLRNATTLACESACSVDTNMTAEEEAELDQIMSYSQLT